MKSKIWLEGFASGINDNNPYGLKDVSGPAGITPEWEEWRKGHAFTWDNLIIPLAMQIYAHEYGMTNDDYAVVTGTARTEWNTLEQWKQDDYLTQSRSVVELLCTLELFDIENWRKILLGRLCQ